MISVIVPVLNQLFLTKNFLECISNNYLKPSEIFLIDNASEEDIQSLVHEYPNLNIVYLRQKRNIGVNESWNIGIYLAKGNLITILNNDIILPKFFFTYIEEVMKHHLDVGICVPITVRGKETVITIENYPYLKIYPLGKREGWAFTIRSEIAKACYPIPRDLTMFFGDDYLFENTRKKNFRVVKMVTNPIYHYGSITLANILGDSKSMSLLEKERRIWERIKKE